MRPNYFLSLSFLASSSMSRQEKHCLKAAHWAGHFDLVLWKEWTWLESKNPRTEAVDGELVAYFFQFSCLINFFSFGRFKSGLRFKEWLMRLNRKERLNRKPSLMIFPDLNLFTYHCNASLCALKSNLLHPLFLITKSWFFVFFFGYVPSFCGPLLILYALFPFNWFIFGAESHNQDFRTHTPRNNPK